MSEMNVPGEYLVKLNYSSGILITGIGGGWDILAGMPLAYELVMNKRNVVAMANYSSVKQIFSRLAMPGDDPEYFIAQQISTPLYLLGREGVQTVRRGYEQILTEHKISHIIMVDGGVDSIMHGTEENCGTILEDSISMSAIAQLPNVVKILVCMGMTTEIEEGLSHFRALQNIATLAMDRGFLGSCSLTPQMEAFQYYKDIAIKAGEKAHRKSHIHSRVIPAVEGASIVQATSAKLARTMGNPSDEEVFINPLMGIYWFFDFDKVAKHNVLLDAIKLSGTFTDAQLLYRNAMDKIKDKVSTKRLAFP